MGDSGYIESAEGKFEIIDTKKENNLSVHLATKMPSDPTASFHAYVNTEKRQNTACNHTATHILDYALRTVLGSHVEQKGSLVSSEMLRFDFSHFQKVTPEELRQVEKLANKMVRENIALEEARDMPIDEARAMGAIALFGEKYGDKVRVVKYGPSVELCGGTHVKSTGMIGMIKILSESSVAAGVRRIEAVSGEAAENYIDATFDEVNSLKEFFAGTPNLLNSVKKSIEENASLKKEVEKYMQERIQVIKDKMIEQATTLGDYKLVVLKGEYNAEFAKSIAFQVRNTVKENLVFIGATEHSGKPTLTLAISDDLVAAGKNATAIAREAAKEIQGGGGGQPFFAQAGGKKVDGLNAAFDKIAAAFK